MDLLECAKCEQRYIVSHADSGLKWACPSDRNGLRLVVLSLPGTSAQIEAALGARQLLGMGGTGLEPVTPCL